MTYLSRIKDCLNIINWVDILNNVLADILISVIIFFLWLIIFFLPNRYKLLLFFGLRTHKSLTIYTSNLQVTPGGAKGITGEKYSYQGTAIPYEESIAANKLQSTFNYFLPSQLEPNKILSKILLSDININIFPSPKNYEMLENNTSIISLGFPAYNGASKYIEEHLRPPAKLVYVDNQNLSITEDYISMRTEVPQNNLNTQKETTMTSAYSLGIVTSGSAARMPGDADVDYPDQPAIGIEEKTYLDNSIGFVQRIYDNKNMRCVFYIAGNSENATAGCAKYLASNWKSLYKEFKGNKPFQILLQISNENNEKGQRIIPRP